MQVEIVILWMIVFSCQAIPVSLNQGLKVGLTLPQAFMTEECSYTLEADYKHCQGIVNYMVSII